MKQLKTWENAFLKEEKTWLLTQIFKLTVYKVFFIISCIIFFIYLS